MSPIDVVVQWFDRRRVPSWLFLIIAYVPTALLFNVVKWIDGSTPLGELDRLTLDAFYFSVSLVSYGLLTRAADRALRRFRPALADDHESFERSRRRLTTMPALQFALSFGVGAAFGLITVATEPRYLVQLVTSPLAFIVVGLLGFVLSYGLAIVVVWQVVRILTEVASLHRHAETVDLFRPGPAHAFARVTAGAGIFLMVLVTFSALTDPATFESPILIVLWVVVVAIAVVAFVVPLLGMRSRLLDEKHRLIDEYSLRTAAVAKALEGAVDAERFEQVGALKTTIEVVEAESARIRRASTWPWSVGTLSGFATTMLVPIATWLITTYAGRVLGF